MSVIMHVDANSAYLSWTAAALLEQGHCLDIRDIPSAIAGDPQNRHGIILAKSISAKGVGIKTGESIFKAKQKYPELKLYPPDYDLFLLCSDAMHTILSQYTPVIQRYSIDECFMDCSRIQDIRQNPEKAAHEIKAQIKEKLGFTVNIGIGENKLCAKMAGELEKPDMVHTIWPNEIETKLWPLPVRELFMVGKATEKKLKNFNISTIGDLAKIDAGLLKSILKSHGQLVYNYANGVDDSEVVINEDIVQKGLGNSMTISFDVETTDELFQELLSLCERVGMRLRRMKRRASLISVHLKSNTFFRCQHQVQLQSYINTTSEIYEIAKRLVYECWKGEPIRQIGVSVSRLIHEGELQLSLFDREHRERQERLEQSIDQIRKKFGSNSIIRGSFANSSIDPIQGGVNDGEYIMMGGFRQ